MATHASKNLLVRESVEEYKIKEQEQHIQAEVICRMPVTKPFKPTKISKKFECEYPTVDPNVSRISQPLPFPDNLADTIAWTDAFVDRIASMTAAQEKKSMKDMTLLAREIERLRTVLATTEVALDNSHTETQKAKDEIKSVKSQLAASEAKSKVQAQTIKDTQALADKKIAEGKLLKQDVQSLTSEKNDLFAKLGKTNKALADEHARLMKEQKKHHQDHDALKKEHDLLDIAERELADIKVQLAGARTESETKGKKIDDQNAKILRLEANVKDTNKRNTDLQADLAKANQELAASEHSLGESKAAIATLTVEVTAGKERIDLLDKKLQATEASVSTLEKTIANITTEKKTVSEELAKTQTDLTKANAEISTLKTDLQLVNAKVVELDGEVKKKETAMKRHQTEKDTANEKMNEAIEERQDLERRLDVAIKARQKLEKELKEEQKTQKEELDGVSRPDRKELEAAQQKLGDAQKSVEELESKISALEKRLIPAAPVNSSRVNILSVEYGGQAYVYDAKDTKSIGSKVLTKLYQHASKGTKFTINNDFFIEDPWRHHEKSCSITYQLDGEGAPLQIVGKEYKELSFVLKK